MTKTFIIENISGLILISTELGTVWETWDISEFTERKLNNAKKRIQKCFQYPVEFINKL